MKKTPRSPVFKRMVRNIGWLVGERGFTGLVSLFYLAIAARALRPEGFGSFTLILTYGQLIASLVQFQSWKGVIRYGAVHVGANQPRRLARLFGFTAMLDWASAIVGAALAIVCVPWVAPLFHWSAAEQQSAALFAGSLLLTTGATPSGVLRLFDRFDLLAYTEAVGPTVRLVGSAVAWVTGAGVTAFLIVWAAASAAQLVAQWAATLFIQRSRVAIGSRNFMTAVRENRRILRFMFQTNFSNSLSLFWMQLGTLVVGAHAGPVEAGGFRIAQRLAQAIAKPVEPITRALYPELARLVAQDEHATVRHVLLRVSFIAAILAVVVVIVAAVAGAGILDLVAGPQFEFAQHFLFLLSIAAAIDLAGFALEPFHNAHGRAGRVLRSRAIGALCYVILLGLLLKRMGAESAAFAAISASLIIFVQLAISAFQILRKRTGSNVLSSSTDEELGAASAD
jgi:O-antigen/teichoic acid export membrane protein